MQILIQLFLNLTLFFYHLLGNNLGWALVAVTVLINLLLFPLNQKSMDMAKKQQSLKPKLDELKKKYGSDKAKLFEEQSKLLKGEGINPVAGCLPAIFQILVLIILIRTFSTVLTGGVDTVAALNQAAYSPALMVQDDVINTRFFAYDLTQKDVLFTWKGFPVPGLLVVLSAFIQFIAARMMLPTLSKEKEVAEKTASGSDDLALDMQKQMVYLFPLIYLWFGTQYPSGLALYFLLSSVFSVLRYSISFGKVGR